MRMVVSTTVLVKTLDSTRVCSWPTHHCPLSNDAVQNFNFTLVPGFLTGRPATDQISEIVDNDIELWGLVRMTSSIPLFAYNRPGNIRVIDQNANQFTFSHLLTFASHLKCRDPRDRIYGLLGLTALHPVDKGLSLQPDYDKSVFDTYKDFTLAHIDLSKSFIMLEHAGLEHREQDDCGPSWVPDFAYNDTSTGHDFHNTWRVPGACGSWRASFEYTMSNSLVVSALLCDSVISTMICPEEFTIATLVRSVAKFIMDVELSQTKGEGMRSHASMAAALYHIITKEWTALDDRRHAKAFPGFCFLLGLVRLMSPDFERPSTFNENS